MGWLLPTGASRSQLHAVPSGAAAISDSSRSRTGSASALNARGQLLGVALVQRLGQQRGAAGLDRPSRPSRDLLACIDDCRYIDDLSIGYPRRNPMSRVQLALNVSDVDEAVAFYSSSSRPSRPSAARLRQLRHRRAAAQARAHRERRRAGTLNHLGVEVFSTDEVAATQARLAGEGMATATEDERHLLLRRAGQGVGRRPRRRAVGDLHRPRRQRRRPTATCAASTRAAPAPAPTRGRSRLTSPARPSPAAAEPRPLSRRPAPRAGRAGRGPGARCRRGRAAPRRGLPGGVLEHPVLVALAREDRARVAAAHRDHDVGGPDDLVGPRLGELAR